MNPYQIPPGPELETLVHQRLFGADARLEDIPQYSREEKAADKVRSRLKQVYGYPVTVGQTNIRHKRYFARLDTGPSTSTEVLAESYPLAVCRLALVVGQSRSAS